MSEHLQALVTFIPLLPLVAAGVLFAFGRSLDRSRAALAGCIGPMLSLVFGLAAYVAVLTDPAVDGRIVAFLGHVIDAESTIGVRIPVRFVLDGLSGVLVLVVTGVGSLIHVYSTRYMAEEADTPVDYARYFLYLNLFSGAMLLLVLAGSLPILFVGWEGVGLCSYLLIGFHTRKEEAGPAAQKAFVVNRIGDACFLIGIFWAMAVAGPTFDGLNAAAAGGGLGPAATGIALLLFAGACGKSAQIPLYVWLPDAMAGPTPVSALIHAATMVTSGVYLLARLQPLLHASPFASFVVVLVGGATALWAALIALGQADVKRILAYSTVSQLGYMFVAVGVGASVLGIFHLVTHAFFKALLFLASGSLILALHHRQRIREMGGLKWVLPVTHLAFLVGALALAGIPPFAGFFSKDAILSEAWVRGSAATATADALEERAASRLEARSTAVRAILGAEGVDRRSAAALAELARQQAEMARERVVVGRVARSLRLQGWAGRVGFVLGLLAAFVTAAYIFRLIGRVFHGERGEWADDRAPPSEPGGPMNLALWALILLSTVGGVICLPAWAGGEVGAGLLDRAMPAWTGPLGEGHGEHGEIAAGQATLPPAAFELTPEVRREWIEEPLAETGHRARVQPWLGAPSEVWLVLLTIAAAIAGAVVGLYFLGRREGREEIAEVLAPHPMIRQAAASSEEGFGVDAFYERFIVGPLRGTAGFCLRWVDRASIDGFLHFLAGAARFLGRTLGRFQGGTPRGGLTGLLAGWILVLLAGLGYLAWSLAGLGRGLTTAQIERWGLLLAGGTAVVYLLLRLAEGSGEGGEEVAS